MLRAIYNFFYRLDKKRDFNDTMHYEYETAPYCGHHYNGHKGKWTHSSYHEGDGGESLLTWFFSIHFPNYDNQPCYVLWFQVPKQRLRDLRRRLSFNMFGTTIHRWDLVLAILKETVKLPLPKWLKTLIFRVVVKIIMR
jgi:hypothetical protein